MSTQRAQHWTDEQLAGRNRRRTIGNWRNYYNRQSGLYEPVDLEIEDDQTEPPEWEGTGPFSFRYQVKRGNLQIFAHDLATPNDAAVIGVRRADNPSHWLVMKALGGNTGSHIVYGPQKAIRWPDYWPNANLNYQATARGVKKRIDFVAPGHPAFFEFGLRMPAAANVQADGSGGLFVFGGGKNQLHLRPPYGWDSSEGAELVPNIRVTGSIESNTVNGNVRIVIVRLTPDVLDLSGAAYPVSLCPSVNISGPTDVEDNLFIENSDGNFGGHSLVMVGYYNTGAGKTLTTGVMRITDSASLPSGTITAFTLQAYRAFNAYSDLSGTMTAQRIVDAATWIEGAGVGAVVVGASDWNHAKHATQPWPGGATGCMSSSDHDNDGGAPTHAYGAYTSGGDVLTPIALDTDWVVDWRSGARVRNGFVLYSDDPGAIGAGVGNRFVFRSTENGSNQPSFDIDYSVGGAPVAAMIPRRIS